MSRVPCAKCQLCDHMESERPGSVNGEREGCPLSSDEEMNVNPNPGLIQDVLISSFTITTHQAPGTQEHNPAQHTSQASINSS